MLNHLQLSLEASRLSAALAASVDKATLVILDHLKQVMAA